MRRTFVLFVILLVPWTMGSQGSTANKYCQAPVPDGMVISSAIQAQAWSIAMAVGAPTYGWSRPGHVMWFNSWKIIKDEGGHEFQILGHTQTLLQYDDKGRANLCEYISVYLPDGQDRQLFVNVLSHEYLHLVWSRRCALEPEFLVKYGGDTESWVREVFDLGLGIGYKED